MIPVSTEYKRQLLADNRNYQIKVEMTLADNTTLTLFNEQIWNNGIVIDQAISGDNTFDIGSAIVGSLKVVINNITERYSYYDFFNAHLVLWLGVEGDVDDNDDQIYYRIGFYTVDEPTYNGSLITLNCLDNMTFFDVPFSDVTGVSFPTTATALLGSICAQVGVSLANANFPRSTTEIPVAPDTELNCREVIQYVAQMCCCYCKIDRSGALKLDWYDKSIINGIDQYDGGSYNTTTTPYSDGDTLDGGDFTYENGDDADGGTFTGDAPNSAYLGHNYQITVSTDNIAVTGCRILNTTSGENAFDVMWVDTTLEQTHERYLLVIENNPFITSANAETLCLQIGNILSNLPIRAFTSTSLSDISYETGDVVTIKDFRGVFYYTWITRFTFTTNNSEQFGCGAESFKKKKESRYSENIRTLTESIVNANQMLTNYDNSVKAMDELAQSAIGYNKYQYNVSGGMVTWLYSGLQIVTTDPANPTFPNSENVFKITGDGVFLSHDGGVTYTQGYDANSGTAILSLIYAVGLNAGWINTGTLKVGGRNGSTGNVNGSIEVYDENDNPLGSWSRNGIVINSGRLKTTREFQKDGITYQRGIDIYDGRISFIPPSLTYAEAYIEMNAAVRTGALASVNIYANGNISLNAPLGLFFDTPDAHVQIGGNGSYSLDVWSTDESRIEFDDDVYLYTSGDVISNGRRCYTGYLRAGDETFYVDNGLIIA